MHDSIEDPFECKRSPTRRGSGGKSMRLLAHSQPVSETRGLSVIILDFDPNRPLRTAEFDTHLIPLSARMSGLSAKAIGTAQ